MFFLPAPIKPETFHETGLVSLFQEVNQKLFRYKVKQNLLGCAFFFLCPTVCSSTVHNYLIHVSTVQLLIVRVELFFHHSESILNEGEALNKSYKRGRGLILEKNWSFYCWTVFVFTGLHWWYPPHQSWQACQRMENSGKENHREMCCERETGNLSENLLSVPRW